MKPFRFSLQRVLDLRRRQEGQARLELVTVAQAIAAGRERWRALRRRLLEARPLVDRSLTGPDSDPALREQAVAHVRALELRAALERRRLRELEEDRARKEDAYRGARRARWMLEKLRARRRAVYLHEAAREELRLYEDTVRHPGRESLQAGS